MAGNDELKLDIEELNRLLETAARPRVKELITTELKRCEQIVSTGSEQSPPGATDKPAADVPGLLQAKTTVVPQKYYKDITNYAWDQSDKFMKIYVSLSGLGDAKQLKKEDIRTEFTDKSFRLKIENLGVKNYQCHVGFLWSKIVPAESYHKLKSDSILLMLKKVEENKTWAFVTEREGQEDKKKKAKMNAETTKDKDPSDGIMGLLKQMYDDGDDEMKRTIAKSWSESRNKTGGGGGAGDFGL